MKKFIQYVLSLIIIFFAGTPLTASANKAFCIDTPANCYPEPPVNWLHFNSSALADTCSTAITSFLLFQQTGNAQIDTVNHFINITVETGTNLKSLNPLITTASPGNVSPSSGTAKDFTSPVIYTVSNKCVTSNYTVSVFLADSICAGSSALLKGSAESPVPGNYNWQLFQNNMWVNAPGTFNTANYQTSSLINPADTVVSYKLRRQIVVNGKTNFDSFYQLYLIPPDTIINTVTAPVPSAICSGVDPGVITGSVPAIKGTFSYQWQSSADSITFINNNGATASNYDPGVVNKTTYYRRLVISNACFTPAISNVVNIKASPLVTNNLISAPSVTSFCVTGSPGIITGNIPSGGNGSYHYQWQISTDSLTYTDINSDTSKDLAALGAIRNTVYLRRSVISGYCATPSVSNVIRLSVYPPITGNSILGPLVGTFCSVANPGIISGGYTQGGIGVYTYQWQVSTDSINFTNIPGTNSIDYNAPQLVKTTYFRRLVVSGPCDTPLVSNVIKFTISNVPPNPVPAAASVQICSGFTATLSVIAQPGLNYNWFDSPSQNNLLYTGPVYTTANLTATTTFYVAAQNAACSSAGTASIQVSVNQSPDAPAVKNDNVAVCVQSAVTLSIASPQKGYIYNWYVQPTGGTPLFTGTDFLTPVINASAIYYAEAISPGGCISSSRTADSVTITPPPQVVAQAAATCPGSSALITASTTTKNATINWYTSATGGAPVYTGIVFNTPALTSPVTYYAEAVDNITGCISPFRFPVTVKFIQPLATPVVSVLTSTVSSITFQWMAVSGATGYEVSIDGGKTFILPSGGADSLTTTISGLTFNQTVIIIVRATGTVDCALSANSAAVTGTAINSNDNLIYVANAFTPNGDGKNDIVYVHSENIRSMKFDVFDQWGELLFTSTNVEKGWDGYYKGTREPVGVYVYFVQAIMNNGRQVTKKGTITLLR